MSDRLTIVTGKVPTHGGCEMCDYGLSSGYAHGLQVQTVYEIVLDGEVRLRLCQSHLERMRRGLLRAAGRLSRNSREDLPTLLDCCGALKRTSS